MMFGKTAPPAPEISIEVQARVHLGLISMHSDAPRKNGGLGFSISHPRAFLRIRPAKELCILDTRTHPMSHLEIAQLGRTIARAISQYKLTHTPEIHISGEMRTHIGMGSGTAITLGAIEGTCLLNGAILPYADLITASRRGGASGVGINVYHSGGLLLDLGVPMDRLGFAPSSAVDAPQRPTVLPTLPMPMWPMILCVPRSILPKTQLQEREFFAKTTPLPPTASFQAAYISLFNLYASVAESDYPAFCNGVTAMQTTSWKKAEISEYGPQLQTLRYQLLERGLDCVGMSSLGPMLFGFGNHDALEGAARDADILDCDVFLTSPSKLGRLIVQ